MTSHTVESKTKDKHQFARWRSEAQEWEVGGGWG